MIVKFPSISFVRLISKKNSFFQSLSKNRSFNKRSFISKSFGKFVRSVRKLSLFQDRLNDFVSFLSVVFIRLFFKKRYFSIL